MSQITRKVAAAAIAVVGLASLSQAVEVVVQNDSLQAGQLGAVQVGFVAGEQAAAWLKSPCDGSIVAVQVFWLNDPQAPGTSIESAIYIYEAGSLYPIPGSVLETLEAPNMNAGFLNEFRFLDENNTVPINIPVDSSEIFVVSFEFANDPPLTGPSVVTDTNGCQSGANSLLAVSGVGSGWFNSCFLGLSGDFVIRAVVDCAESSGACCLPDGSCSVMTQTECTTASGVFQGILTECSQVSCPQPTGACCFESTGGCLDRTQSVCIQLGGVWSGPGTTCATTVCFPIGACCLPDGSCVGEQSPDACEALGGTFQGDETVCGEVTCPDPVGACCTVTGSCLVETQENCEIASGAWAGAGTDCTDADQNDTADVCEPFTPGDMNCDHIVNAFDIEPFIAALLSPANYATLYPDCDLMLADINQSGLVDAFDVEPFINLLLGNAPVAG